MTARVGDYRLGDLLGRGGWGAVFIAEAVGGKLCGRKVAIKILHADRGANGLHVARFQQEAAALRRLDHPHIVRVLDAGDADGQAYVAMELLEGQTLDELLACDGALSASATCALIRQVADGLRHIHVHRLVHRDIKPSNLFLTADGTLKILDLGIACLTHELRDPATRLTLTGGFIGTPPYAAPEQQSGRAVDIRADIYSLGVVFDELLRGAASSVRASPPRDLQRVIDRMRHFDPDQRFQTPQELLAALRRYERRHWFRWATIGVGLTAVAPLAWLLPRWFGNRWVDHYRDSFDTLNDSFWQVRVPQVEATDPRPDVTVENGELVLRNRGYLVSKEEFPQGVALQFHWTWTKGDARHADHLAVALRTSGSPGGKGDRWQTGTYEIQDGTVVKFAPEDGRIDITSQRSGPLFQKTGLPMDRDVVHFVRIADDGRRITVWFNDPRTPVMSEDLPRAGTSVDHRVAIYNREPTGGLKESRLDHLLIQVPDR